MADGDEEKATVLIVDDEEKLANMFTLWLRQDYDVQAVYEGEAVLPAIDETVDVVLLDRRMPGLSGDEVLEMIRRKGVDVSVVVITAVDPDTDILEMPFDDYICKPVQHDSLVAAIDRQLQAREYGDELHRYLRLRTKQRLLEREKHSHELEENPEWQDLQRSLDELEERLRRTVDDFDDVLEAFVRRRRGRGRRRT